MIEEAFERCGKELRTGYDFRTSRRSLNLLAIEWANRGINLWTVEQGQIPMATGQALYPVPVDTIDLLDMVIRQNNATSNQIDINISRISEPVYTSIPNKLAQGRPIQVYFSRQSGQQNPTTISLAADIDSSVTTITLSSVNGLATNGFIKINNETISYANVDPVNNQLLNCARGQNNTTAVGHSVIGTPPIVVQNLPYIAVWPTPNDPGNQYMFVYYRMRRIQDAGTGVTELDIPFRFIPCMAAGLAYHLSIKLPEVDPGRISLLKSEYEEAWLMASTEDRDTSPLRIVPRNMFYY
jgi:hypothetical protein